MWRPEPQAGSGSPGCPDLLLHVQTLRSPPSPLYLSFFEEECRAIAARLRLGAESSPGPGELSALHPETARPVTSTPLPVPSHGRLPESGVGDCEAAAAPGPSSGPELSVGRCEVPAAPGPSSAPELSVGSCEAPAAPGPSSAPELSVGGCEAPAAPGPGEARRKPGCLPQPAAGGGSGARLSPLSAPSQRVRRGAGQPSGGRPSSPACSSGRGRTRLSLARPRASLGLQLPAVGTGRGAWETRFLQPPGTRLKRPSPARSRLQHVSGASQQAQPSTRPKPAPRDREMKSNSAPASCLTRSREASAVKAGSHKQPSSRLSTAIPTLTSRSSLRPPGKAASSKRFCLSKGSTTQELVCNRTQELKENGERKERLIAAGTVLGAGKANRTWVCEESCLSSELAPGLTSRCEDAVPAEQSARDQLSQELERVKKELEQVKGELADKTAQCEAYQQTVSSLQAQLRAAGIRLKDAAVFDSDDLGRD